MISQKLYYPVHCFNSVNIKKKKKKPKWLGKKHELKTKKTAAALLVHKTDLWGWFSGAAWIPLVALWQDHLLLTSVSPLYQQQEILHSSTLSGQIPRISLWWVGFKEPTGLSVSKEPLIQSWWIGTSGTYMGFGSVLHCPWSWNVKVVQGQLL